MSHMDAPLSQLRVLHPQAGYGAHIGIPHPTMMRYHSFHRGLDVAIAMWNGRLMAFLVATSVVSNMQARQVGIRSRWDFVLI